MIPVVWLSVKQTSVPIPQIVYGFQLEKVTEKEKALREDPKEKEVIAIFKAQADALGDKLKDVKGSLEKDRADAGKKLEDLKSANAPAEQIAAAEKALSAVPKDEAEAKTAWTKAKAAAEARAKPLAGMPAHAQIYAGDPNGDQKAKDAYDTSRRNFIALIFCLMVGTAALPHILMRYYTTPSVREARASVGWSLFFIFLLYFTAPALAVLVKYEVFHVLVGTPFDKLPAWIANWSKVDPALLSVVDINKDGILQLGEMRIGGRDCRVREPCSGDPWESRKANWAHLVVRSGELPGCAGGEARDAPKPNERVYRQGNRDGGTEVARGSVFSFVVLANDGR